MPESLRAKAAAAIRGARHGQPAEAGIAAAPPGSVITTDLTFRIDADHAKRLEEAHARIRRELDPPETETAY